MDNTTLLLDGISLLCGLYCLYTWLKLTMGKRLFKNGLLIPKDKQISDCLDEEEYIRFISPRLLVLALATTLYGAFFMLNDVLEEKLLPYPWNFVPLALVMAVLVWYAVANSKANRDFFGM